MNDSSHSGSDWQSFTHEVSMVECTMMNECIGGNRVVEGIDRSEFGK